MSQSKRAGLPSISIPPTVLVLLSTFSAQLGSSFAKILFGQIGPGGTVLLRLGFGALIMLTLSRPKFRGYRRQDYLTAVIFGVTFACMNSLFYAAIARIPLGIAVAIEFVGPLSVAVAQSRRAIDFLWIVLAIAGILLLTPFVGVSTLDLLGAIFALLAGVFWAIYILVNVRVGQAFQGGTGLTIALCVGAVIVLPYGIVSGGARLLKPSVLLMGLGVSLFSSVIIYLLELEALRKLPSRVFGVLMSIEPAIAALLGFIILHERLSMQDLLAIALVIVASLGSSLSSRDNKPVEQPV